MADDREAVEVEVLQDVVSSLPPARFVFAYGSGALPQRGVTSTSRMLDFVLAVDKAEQWHRENMYSRGNWPHYSTLMTWLGPRAVSSVQQSALGARIYYNTLVPWKNGRTIKYGVITLSDLLDDLREWRTLYVSGRMQKPVRILQSDETVELANQKNIEYAARAALLTLPEQFDEVRFFEAVASLSYVGDPRISMAAEDPKKVSRIVSSNREAFRQMYRPALNRLQKYVSWNSVWGSATQNMQTDARVELLGKLPGSFVKRMRSYVNEDEFSRMSRTRGFLANKKESFERMIARGLASRGEEYCRRALTSTISRTVRQSSTAQMFKGILTAGMVRSAKYAISKLGRGRLCG
mmetsp:Transcript_1807/g.5480  ORF Transcript_1807/g.5480 Transcript_1807/m.5480 type:complete len:351 (+) Transcript_1807:79-1131(+)|eukprot:CAMPEP_0198735892 /NCGR_PEP_ID=MMETSP1475-20131203/62294_1 /TAXON_ID= ORGANISM="Unidentified sp., Strain CCMP1999" /NCGR_SAMPLE_ID=MMETSP1475 /ASSEMBLY_ACC=CAM_ASM_001111 /LENGTH=350 /DNA_ID=CAMNT_0044499619 /DNA_START=71 /DNA_END=1123 /DNA_ORIENTATION=+